MYLAVREDDERARAEAYAESLAHACEQRRGVRSTRLVPGPCEPGEVHREAGGLWSVSVEGRYYLIELDRFRESEGEPGTFLGLLQTRC